MYTESYTHLQKIKSSKTRVHPIEHVKISISQKLSTDPRNSLEVQGTQNDAKLGTAYLSTSLCFIYLTQSVLNRQTQNLQMNKFHFNY